MMANRSIVIAILVCIIQYSSISAQELGDLLFGIGNSKTYIGQYNYKGNRKNGFGIERYKNGALFLGDFSENKISGKGMFISQKKGISNVENAIVYVGNWVNGRKEGKGRCYDTFGTLIYEGKFISDKPIESFIPSESLSSHYFKMFETKEGLYLGEIVNDIPNGLGIVLSDENSISFGNLRDGIYDGIGIKIYNTGNWEVGKWIDGVWRAFEDSESARRNIEQNRNANKIARKEMWSNFWGAAENFAMAGVYGASLVNSIQNGSNNGNSNYSSVNTNEHEKKNSRSSGSTITKGKCKRCGGTGNCSPTSYGNRKAACHGSKLCGYCNGTGWIAAGSDKAICKACNGKAVCKTCKGTGKCQQCNGSGKG